MNDCVYYTVPSSPLNFFVSTVPGSPYQLSAMWSPPIPKNGIITAYTVYCNTSASQAYPEQMIGPNIAFVRTVVNGTKLTATFSGLNPYTNYDCYVTANTSVGEGSFSNIAIARTGESGECIVQTHIAKTSELFFHVVVSVICSIHCQVKKNIL